jgi:alcohol dehydrogenase, propanol-preferring
LKVYAAILTELGKSLNLGQVEDPKPKGAEVLVKIASSGLCHSDLHIWQGHYGSVKVQERGVKLPLIMGHESAGTVAELGSEAKEKSDIQIGDRAVVYPWIGEGACKACISGNDNLCRAVKPLGILLNGGFAEYVNVPHYRYVVPVSEKISLDSAAPMACAAITAYSALKKAELQPTDYLAIFGIGGVGHLGIQLASKLFGSTIIAVDERNEALNLAKRLGAKHSINPNEQDPVKEIMELTGGIGADAVVDFVNTTATSSLAFRSMKRGGRIILVGLSGEASAFPLPLIAMKGIGILGSYVGNLRDLLEVTRLLESGKIEVTTNKMPLSKANEAIELLAAQKVVGRIILNP